MMMIYNEYCDQLCMSAVASAVCRALVRRGGVRGAFITVAVFSQMVSTSARKIL